MHLKLVADGDRRADAEVVHYSTGMGECVCVCTGGGANQSVYAHNAHVLHSSGRPGSEADSLAPLACFNP